MPHRAAGGVAGGPALARARVRRMPVRPQSAAIHPGVRHGVDDLLARAAEQRGDHRGGCDPDQQHMVEPDAIEAVLQGENALDLVRLDHSREHIAHRDRLAGAREVVGHGENSAQIIRRVAPLRRQPRVIEVEPANHGADVEGRVDGIEFVGGAGNARAVGEGGARNHGPHQFRAGRIFQRLEAAGQSIHEAVAGGLIGELAVDPEAQSVVGDRRQDVIGRGTFGGFDVVGHESLMPRYGRSASGTKERLSGPM